MIVPTVEVSDHAVLRYLERVRGIDVEAARAEIAAITGIAASLGAKEAARDGHVYVLRGYTVTTVLPKGDRNRRLPAGGYKMRAGR